MTPRRQLFFLILAATLLRSVFALTGFGIDEIYTVATAREFHLSGYDHPPMAWWLATVMQKLFATASPWVIRLPFVLLSAIATWQIFRLTELLFSARAGLWAALAFCLAPALGITDGAWVLPDGPLLVGLLGGAICLAQLFFDPSPNPKTWLAAGAFGGLAMLSKYHGVFFFFGAFLFVLAHRRHWLASVWPYLGAALALLIFSPVIFWNIEHHFASFAFQSGRTGETHFHPLNPLMVLAGQAAFLTPWIWLALIVATRSALRQRAGEIHAKKCRLLLYLAAPLILLFTCISAVTSGQILFHWAMPGYLFLFPILGDWLAARDGKPYIKRFAIFSAALLTVLIGVILFLWFAPATAQKLGLPADPLADMRPLTEINAYLDAHPALASETLVIAPTKWHSAGQFDVALAGRVPVTCLCRDARGYGILAPLSGFAGRDVLIPIPLKHAGEAQAKYAPLFAHFKRLDDLTIHQGGTTTQTYAMFLGTGLKADLAGLE